MKLVVLSHYTDCLRPLSIVKVNNLCFCRERPASSRDENSGRATYLCRSRECTQRVEPPLTFMFAFLDFPQHRRQKYFSASVRSLARDAPLASCADAARPSSEMAGPMPEASFMVARGASQDLHCKVSHSIPSGGHAACVCSCTCAAVQTQHTLAYGKEVGRALVVATLVQGILASHVCRLMGLR